MLKLRDYQEKMVNEVGVSFAKGHRRIVCQSPTGSGKTVIFSYICKGAIEKGNDVLILTDRIELLTETGGTLSEFGIEFDVVNADNKYLPYGGGATVCMAQTLKRRLAQEMWVKWLKTKKVIIIDECHKQEFNKFFVDRMFEDDALVLGFTATPKRSGSQRQLAEDYSFLIHGPTTPELIDRGYLVPDDYYSPDSVDMEGVTKNNWGEYEENQMASRFNKYDITQSAIDHIYKLAADEITLVFCSNIRHTIDTCKALNNAGLKASYVVSPVPKPKPPKPSAGDTVEELRAKQIMYQLKLENYEAYIESEREVGGTREERIEAWRRGDFRIMVNAGILTTGFNFPAIRAIVFLRKYVSENLWLQCLGRGSRPYEDKESFRVLDFGANGHDIGMFNRVRTYRLIHRHYSRGGGAPTVKECGAYGKDRHSHIGCGAYVSSGQRVCKYCGYIFEIEKIEKNVELKPFLDGEHKDVVEKYRVKLLEREKHTEFEGVNFKELLARHKRMGHSRFYTIQYINGKLGLDGLKEYGKYMGYKTAWAYREHNRMQGKRNVRIDKDIKNDNTLFG